MESKLFWAIMREWISLLSGSDLLASKLIDQILETSEHDDHRLLSPDVVDQLLTFNANCFPLPHPELDPIWRENTLRNLCTLASSNVDFKRLSRECRASLNYSAVDGIPREQILQLNLSALLRFGTQLEDRVRKLEENSNEVEELRGVIKDVTLFKVQQNCRRLRRWMERAVIMDLINPSPQQLSEEGQRRFEQFRLSPKTRDVRDSIAKVIFTSVDRRQAWSTMEHLGISADEFATTALVVAHTTRRIQDGTWEGSLESDALFGIDDNFFEEYRQGVYVHDEFLQLEEYAPVAQVYYEQGLSVEQAMNRAKDLAASRRVIDRFLEPSAHVRDASSDPQGASPPLGAPPTSNSVEMKSTHMRTGGEFIAELVQDFGTQSVIEFDTIDLGLTGVMPAQADVIAERLRVAFAGKLEKDEKTRSLQAGEWQDSLQRTDVKLVALSYKHKSHEVRMGEKTIVKVAAALQHICASCGFEQINVWTDAVLSANKKSQKSNWAVLGLYPYLVCDIVSVLGIDDEYDDGQGSSMWMRVEDMCSDEKTKVFVTLDNSERGFSVRSLPSFFQIHDVLRSASHEGIWRGSAVLDLSSKIRSRWSSDHTSSVKARMMMTAQELCKGALMNTKTSWPEDKNQLLLWAEQCMLQNQPVLFGLGLERLRVLQADNLEESNNIRGAVDYITKARERGFIELGTARTRGLSCRWQGTLELLPGLLTASRREFIPLLTEVDEDKRVLERVLLEGVPSQDVVTIVVAEIRLTLHFAPNSSDLKDVRVDVIENMDENRWTPLSLGYDISIAKEMGLNVEKVRLPLSEKDELSWVKGQVSVVKSVG